MMTKKKGELSLQRHREIAAMLLEMRNTLVDLGAEVGNAYPFSGQRGWQFKHLRRAQSAIDYARVALEERLFEDYPEAADIDLYYPAKLKETK